jgi:hypothetical protein
MAKNQTGPRNNNWRGGRSVASNGYIIVRVGVRHHLADVRGYAYEHRVEAEKKIGRRLRGGELVHHVNGNKQDNQWANLEVHRGNAEHFFEHRRPDSNSKKPGEINRLISCRCGCGEKFHKYDASGRPRVYVIGHNMKKELEAASNGR